ncbi:uncharacterized protein IUM83_15799 [Phytophthora cinnamomi]|uniref:uncharacterized protein n=1 Tax=Phytophthora cinnamomi TaxID=4785 RepID=UPI00355A16F5|nr:hypothetical protein IUM83_15799 [Phytophthora cinnamomi]
MIGSLPRDYDNVVQTFLASHTTQNPDDPPNYEQLEQALEIAYDHIQNRKEEGSKGDEEDKVFFAAGVVVVDEELIAVEDVDVVVVDEVLAVVEEQIKEEIAVLVAVRAAPVRSVAEDASTATNKSTKSY